MQAGCEIQECPRQARPGNTSIIENDIGWGQRCVMYSDPWAGPAGVAGDRDVDDRSGGSEHSVVGSGGLE
jgi:hypothetical protein